MLIFGTFKTLSCYHALDLLVLLYKFYAKFVLQSFFFPNTERICDPRNNYVLFGTFYFVQTFPDLLSVS